jgi:outer membrane immunogenic protein
MIRGIHLAILAFAIIQAVSPLRGQSTPSGKAPPAQLEATLAYSADRGSGSANSNFWMQGGKAEFSAAFSRSFSLVGDVAVLHASNINSANGSIGLVSYLFGPRFSYRRYSRFTPFGQILIGGVHGFDAYFPSAAGFTLTPDAFAMAAGGGVNVPVSRHLAIRPVQVDYFQTQLPNNAANRENNLRVGAGIVFAIGSPR